MILIIVGMRIKDLVIFVSVLSKHKLYLPFVKVMQKNYLDLFVVIFGVHIKSSHYVVLNIFLQLLTKSNCLGLFDARKGGSLIVVKNFCDCGQDPIWKICENN